jgi:hypothetical protein
MSRASASESIFNPSGHGPTGTVAEGVERSIEIVPPGRDGIINILLHVRNDLPDEQLGPVADMIEGLTPPEIMEIVRRAKECASGCPSPLARRPQKRRSTGIGNLIEAECEFLRAEIYWRSDAVIDTRLLSALDRYSARAYG